MSTNNFESPQHDRSGKTLLSFKKNGYRIHPFPRRSLMILLFTLCMVSAVFYAALTFQHEQSRYPAVSYLSHLFWWSIVYSVFFVIGYIITVSFYVTKYNEFGFKSWTVWGTVRSEYWKSISSWRLFNLLGIRYLIFKTHNKKFPLWIMLNRKQLGEFIADLRSYEDMHMDMIECLQELQNPVVEQR